MTSIVTLAEIEHEFNHGTPRRRFIVPGVLPAGPSILYGSSGSGKSGIAISTSIHIAAGLPWASCEVSQGSVLYIAGEDYYGVRERLLAAARSLGLAPADLPLALAEPPVDGIAAKGSAEVIHAQASEVAYRTRKPVSLVVVDTLAACYGAESQDDARAASTFMNEMDALSRGLQCAVLAVHHTGKSGPDMRGSQVFFDRADGVFKTARRKPRTLLTIEKLRNGPAGSKFSFEIAATDLNTSGGQISVQVVHGLQAELADTAEPARPRAKPQGDTEAALKVLRQLSSDSRVPVSVWKEACYTQWSGKPSDGARRTAFSTAKANLLDAGRIHLDGDFVSVSIDVSVRWRH